jgi:hypothetical protein
MSGSVLPLGIELAVAETGSEAGKVSSRPSWSWPLALRVACCARSRRSDCTAGDLLGLGISLHLSVAGRLCSSSLLGIDQIIDEIGDPFAGAICVRNHFQNEPHFQQQNPILVHDLDADH